MESCTGSPNLVPLKPVVVLTYANDFDRWTVGCEFHTRDDAERWVAANLGDDRLIHDGYAIAELAWQYIAPRPSQDEEIDRKASAEAEAYAKTDWRNEPFWVEARASVIRDAIANLESEGYRVTPPCEPS